MSVYQPVGSSVNLPGLEEQTLSYWDAKKIFEKTLEASATAKPYSFYDGPPL